MGIFSKFFRREAATDVFTGYVDHHSHILPGVDDGFRKLEDSLECLKAYENYGFAELWLTPHIMEDFPNSTDSLREKFEELNAAYTGSIKLHLASENMLDTLFAERLANMDFLPMGDRLLVETSYFNPPANFHELLDEIMHKGLRPLLAHPERYRYMTYDDYENLLSKGIVLQLNVFSLLGMYGQQAKEKALHLLKHDAYTLSGTDIHSLRQLGGIEGLMKNNDFCSRIKSLPE